MEQSDTIHGPRAKPQYRRALGELTNTPLLLSPGAQGLSPRPPQQHHSPLLGRDEGVLGMATPPKINHGPTSSPDTVTPTHNLKLLTELASKMPGAVPSSSARQTLQFEDHEPTSASSARLKNRNLLLHGHSEKEANSPHRDHSYIPRTNNAEADQFVSRVVKTTPPPRLLPRTVSPCPPPTATSTERGGNRKEKSLGILAERMLASLPYAMGAGESTELQLDDTARVLSTERRRIYDIVNVFEAVQIMSKVGKNVYQWHGRTYLVQSLAWLRQLATKLGVMEQYNLAKEQEMQTMIHNQENVNIENVSPGWANSPTFSPLASPSPLNSPYNSPNDPNGTSMGINTQKFLMLFLVSPQPQTLTLDFAAKVIHGIHQVEKTRLTRVRRLYDIANILQSLGLIRKVSLTDGRGKKPAYQYIGPDVSTMELSDEEKRGMPATRQKNSLLAVGRSLSLLPETPSSTSASTKRTRSLSEERKSAELEAPAKLVRTRSETREDGSSSTSSLFDLGAVCGAERKRLDEAPSDDLDVTKVLMKPPTPGRPPSRKKHLLQRYYSDSALLSSSLPLVKGDSTFTSPKPVTVTLLNPSPRQPPQQSPVRALSLHSVPQSPRANYSPLHPSPLTKPPTSSSHAPLSPRVRTPMRSPITPRDLRNSSILPPNSPTRSKLITCSPMGPVGRSLLSSPASPRAPIDLTVRQQRPQGRSPLASRALNLPPSPLQQVPSTPPVSRTTPSQQEKSPLLRAYLANSKTKSFFQPINSPSQLTLEEGVSILPPDIHEPTSNGSTTLSLLSSSPTVRGSSPPSTVSPDGSTKSSSASELEGIFGKPLVPRGITPLKPSTTKTLHTPIDFSGLISPASRSSTNRLSSTFMTMHQDLQTPVLYSNSTPSPKL